MGVIFTMKALVVVIMGGVGNLLGALVGGPAARRRRDRGVAPARSRPDAGGDLCSLPGRAAGAADRPVREARAMSLRNAPWLVLGFVLAVALLGLPLVASGYVLALAISMLSFTVLATAWALFSGPTQLHLAGHAPPSSASAPTRPPCWARWRRGPSCCWLRPALGLALVARRRPVDLASVRRALRHLHVRPGRARAPAGHLVRGEREGDGRALSLPRHAAAGHLLAAAGAGCRRASSSAG